MSAPAEITTPEQAAQFVWDRGGSVLSQNTPAAGIKPKHFNTRPVADVKAVVLKDKQALAAFCTAWTALQKKHNIKVNAPTAPAAGAAKSTAQTIYDDMRRQYELWKKGGCRTQNRGAWWGSARPGVTAGAKAVPSGEVKAITALAQAGHWEFKNSFSGDLSWHKKSPDGKTDFIYHTKTP